MPPSGGKLSSNRRLSWVPPKPESPPMRMPVGAAKTTNARPPAAMGLYSLGKANPGVVVMSKCGTTPMHSLVLLQGGAVGSYSKKPIAVPPSSKLTFCKFQVRSVACVCEAAKRKSEAVNPIRRTLLMFFRHFYYWELLKWMTTALPRRALFEVGTLRGAHMATRRYKRDFKELEARRRKGMRML